MSFLYFALIKTKYVCLFPFKAIIIAEWSAEVALQVILNLCINIIYQIPIIPFKSKMNSNSFVNGIAMEVRDTAHINKNSHNINKNKTKWKQWWILIYLFSIQLYSKSN